MRTLKVLAGVQLVTPAALRAVLTAVAAKEHLELGSTAVAVRRHHQFRHHNGPDRTKVGRHLERKEERKFSMFACFRPSKHSDVKDMFQFFSQVLLPAPIAPRSLTALAALTRSTLAFPATPT